MIRKRLSGTLAIAARNGANGRKCKRSPRTRIAAAQRRRMTSQLREGFSGWVEPLILSFSPMFASGENFVDLFRQLEIVVADAVDAVRVQVDHHLIPHVEPLRVV